MPFFTRAFVALTLSAGAAVAAVPAMSPASAAVATRVSAHEVADTVGTEFWTAIPQGFGPSSPRTLYVSPTADGSVTISDRTGAVIATRELSAGQVEAISIPADREVTDSDGVGAQGLHVVSTTPVSIYATIIEAGASTGFQLYPLDALGTSYRALGYVGLGGTMGSRMTLVGTADDTTVTITPATTVDAHPAGTPYAVRLDQGQTYQLTASSNADVTGTSVDSDKPVAVLSGAGCADVPTSAFACNPLLQEVAPTNAWGTEFVSARLATRTKGDTYRILADEDGTVVSVGGVEKATIDAGQFYEAVLPEDATNADPGGVLIQTSKPTLVAQYGNGTTYDNSTGDPLMITVPPAGQLLTSYVVTAPDVSDQTPMQPYLNIVAQTRDLGQVMLDGTALANEKFTAVAGSDYSIAQLQVDAGQHSVRAPHQVGVTVYEWGQYDGFGFPGGQALAPIADAPAPPTATALTSTGQAGQAQSVTLTLTEDQAATLVDGSTETDTVEVPGEGTYTLDADTGVITFTPLAGFSGEVTPVTYRIQDSYNQSAESTYTPTVTAPQPPTATPLTSSGRGTQTVTVSVPADGSLTLLADGTETTQVAVRGGTYLLDAANALISFVPAAGFVGTAEPVAYRIRDAFDQTAESTYTATVTAASKPTPPIDPTSPSKPAQKAHGTLALPKLARVANSRWASVPARCRVAGGTVARCTVTLTAKVHGSMITVGRGSWNGAAGKIRLNAVGRSLATNPGGRPMKGTMVVHAKSGKTAVASAWSRVVTKRFTLARSALFASESKSVTKRDRSWLRNVGRHLGAVRTVTCTGYADAQGREAYNRVLSRKRAAAACAALHLPSRVHVVVKAMGAKHPVANNHTAQGRAHNRRATITLTY